MGHARSTHPFLPRPPPAVAVAGVAALLEPPPAAALPPAAAGALHPPLVLVTVVLTRLTVPPPLLRHLAQPFARPPRSVSRAPVRPCLPLSLVPPLVRSPRPLLSLGIPLLSVPRALESLSRPVLSLARSLETLRREHRTASTLLLTLESKPLLRPEMCPTTLSSASSRETLPSASKNVSIPALLSTQTVCTCPVQVVQPLPNLRSVPLSRVAREMTRLPTLVTRVLPLVHAPPSALTRPPLALVLSSITLHRRPRHDTPLARALRHLRALPDPVLSLVSPPLVLPTCRLTSVVLRRPSVVEELVVGVST